MTADTRPRVLVVDDDEKLLEALTRALQAMGYAVEGHPTPRAGLARARKWAPDAAIVDLKMPGMDGIELAAALQGDAPDLPVIVLTGFGTIRSAVEAMRRGVYDYLTKPFDLDEVELTLKRALEHRDLRRQNRAMSEALGGEGNPREIVGDSAVIRAMVRRVQAVAGTDSTVLVTGETGTGKELVARSIHRSGPRKDEPFVTVDCAALHDTLLESELFGHSRGAFTGAYKERAGYFEVASRGTVFLDEVGELDPGLQKKLLRVLEERTFSRIGETRVRRTRARVVAATNRDLEAEVAASRFREDLFYRLKVIAIPVPPLRARREDIPLLVRHHLPRLTRRLNRRTRSVSPDALETLQRYPWPGNVRELVNVLEHALTFHDAEVLGREHLPDAVVSRVQVQGVPGITYPELKARVLDDASREYLVALLRHHRGNVSRVAEHAGLDRRHVHRLLRRLGLDPSGYRSP